MTADLVIAFHASCSYPLILRRTPGHHLSAVRSFEICIRKASSAVDLSQLKHVYVILPVRNLFAACSCVEVFPVDRCNDRSVLGRFHSAFDLDGIDAGFRYFIYVAEQAHILGTQLISLLCYRFSVFKHSIEHPAWLSAFASVAASSSDKSAHAALT